MLTTQDKTGAGGALLDLGRSTAKHATGRPGPAVGAAFRGVAMDAGVDFGAAVGFNRTIGNRSVRYEG